MLNELLAGNTFALVFVFARIGSAIMLLPGFGETFVAPRVRLLIALGVTMVVTPVVIDLVPPAPESPFAMLALLGREIAIGLFLGALARMMVSALHTAGVIMGFQTSLANAQLFDPINAAQGSLFGSFLNILGVFLIFVTDLHHMMLMAIADSYALFSPSAELALGDFSETAVRVLGGAFTLAMQIAAPFMVAGLLFYLSLGLLARLMPQVQIFFVAMPLQIMLGFMVMAITISAGMMWFLGSFQNTFQGLLLVR
jgi:flagellar biosynthetic protein FliR